MRDWIALARPRQWTKNLLLYAPLLFTAGEAWGISDDGSTLLPVVTATIGVAAFCLLSSAGYLLNDARDAAADRLHPRKQHRPIAAGRITPHQAQRGALVLAVIGLGVASALGATFAMTALAYLVGTVAYSLALRRVAVVDVVAVAFLFVIRVLAGAAAIDEPASGWIVVCTFTGALFVSSVKRQQDRWLLGDEIASHRAARGFAGTIRDWPARLALGAGAATALSYTAYAAFAENVPRNGAMLASVPFVVAALARYWVVAKARPERDADEIAVRDPWVMVIVIAFLLVAVPTLVST